MKEGIVSHIDSYLRRSDTLLARNLQAISPEQGLAYRTSRKKDIAERAIAAPLAIVTTPLVGALAAAVKVEDGGRSFYQSKRIGQHGEVFNVIKIRSLYDGADQDIEINNLIINNAGNAEDPRSTRIGAWMRRWRLDELPQLWQIVNGKLSLFGMRAVDDLTIQKLNEQRSEHAFQLYKDYIAAKPAAINPMTAFNNGNGNLNERYHYNSFYARRASLGMDLYMGFRTVVRPFLYKKSKSK